MLILGIETATERVSVAIGNHEGVLAMFEVTRGRRHAETLTPAIEFVCQQADIKLPEISVIAVDVGPGLFTGMRGVGCWQSDGAGFRYWDHSAFKSRPVSSPCAPDRETYCLSD